MKVSGQLHASAALPPGKEPPGTYWIGDWVIPRAGLVAVKKRKILPCRESNPGRPARSPVSILIELSYTSTPPYVFMA
jgi:hypothetical protein